VLFEGGAGEKIRRELLHRCDVHTLLRLPTGIWYSAGVKANVLFFEKKPIRKIPATKGLWVYDLRSSRSFSIRKNPILTSDLGDFIDCYRSSDRSSRVETDHFRRFEYSEIVNRDKANLDLQWREDEPESVLLSSPETLMKEVLQHLDEAIREFSAAHKEIR
jgi:type I restriction enzyme M protein